MLKKIRLKNFLSFREETTIDFEMTNYKILQERNCTNGIIKGAMFFGPNASGKSNALDAISFLLNIMYSKANYNYSFRYFCLFPTSLMMELSYTFIIDGKKIEYDLKFPYNDKRDIVEELAIDGKTILERIGKNGKSIISERKDFDDIPNNNLLLREIYFNTRFRSYEVLQKWFEYMENSIVIDMYKREIQSNETNSADLYEYFDKYGVDEVNKFLLDSNFGQKIRYEIKKEEGKEEHGVIRFEREGLKGSIPYPLESIGNQNLVRLIPFFLQIIKNGGILVIDEFSSGFHNMLEEMLIKYFMKSSENSQIFFVSHSTNLLNNSLLRPDQLFLVTFENEHGSKVERISKYQPREAQNIEKMYLGGVFDGLPEYKLPNQ